MASTPADKLAWLYESMNRLVNSKPDGLFVRAKHQDKINYILKKYIQELDYVMDRMGEMVVLDKVKRNRAYRQTVTHIAQTFDIPRLDEDEDDQEE